MSITPQASLSLHVLPVVAPGFCASHPMPSSPFRPLQPLAEPHSFGHGMGFLTLEELGRVACVSRVWRYESEAAHIWKKSCETNQFPLVVNRNGTMRNYKQDVRVLYPITISGSNLVNILERLLAKRARLARKCLIDSLEEIHFSLQKS